MGGIADHVMVTCCPGQKCGKKSASQTGFWIGIWRIPLPEVVKIPLHSAGDIDTTRFEFLVGLDRRAVVDLGGKGMRWWA